MKEVVPGALDGERIDRVLSLMTGLPRSQAAEVLERGGVRLDGAAVKTRSRRVHEGEVVEVEMPVRAGEELVPDPTVPVTVVHEDEHVVVVDKPPGVVVHSGAGQRSGTLVHGLLHRYPEMAGVGEAGRPGIVHRLDKGTSGLLVVARTPEAYASLVSQIGAHSVDRRYLALVWGHVEAGRGLVDAPVGRSAADPTRMAVSARGRDARTRYEVVERFTEPAALTLVECRLETGRTHQIRVHLAAIDHPVVGDSRYGRGRRALTMSRPFLHAHRLAFDHPAHGRPCKFQSSLPVDLESIRERLR
jgi:23S rRNA pseudouridine1911/1915/1917 synthase